MVFARTTVRPLPQPGRGIAVISERESLGDGFYKLTLLRALRRAYPGEKITWIVSEGDSPYRTIMAGIVAPLVDEVIVHAKLRRPWREAVRRLRALPRFGLAIDNRTNNGVVAATTAAAANRHLPGGNTGLPLLPLPTQRRPSKAQARPADDPAGGRRRMPGRR